MDLKKYLDDKCIEIIIAGYEQGFRQKAILSTLETYGHKRKDDKAITQPFLSTVLIELGKRSNTLSKRKKEVNIDFYDKFGQLVEQEQEQPEQLQEKDQEQEIINLECKLFSKASIKQIKEVIFNNVTLLGVELLDNKIYVAIKKICNDLGIDSSSQYQRIKRDDTLKDGTVIITIPDNKGINQNTLCLDIDYLPMFLIGIQADRCNQEARPYLKEFKLKAKDKLSEVFINKSDINAPGAGAGNNNYLALFDLTLKSLKEQENKILSLENKFNVIETKLDMQEANKEKLLSEMSTCEYSDRLPLEVPTRKKITTIVNAYVLNKFPNSDDKNYSSVWSILDKEIYKRLGLDIYTRLENLKSKGIKKTRLDIMEDLNILDAVYDIASFIFKIKKEV